MGGLYRRRGDRSGPLRTAPDRVGPGGHPPQRAAFLTKSSVPCPTSSRVPPCQDPRRWRRTAASPSAVARHQPGKPVLRQGCREVVADRALVLEELGRHDGADGVAAQILRAGRAAAVAVEPRQGIGAARFEFATEDVALAQLKVSISKRSPRAPSAPAAGVRVTS